MLQIKGVDDGACVFADLRNGVDVRLEEVGDCPYFLRGPAFSISAQVCFMFAAVCEEGLVDESYNGSDACQLVVWLRRRAYRST